MEAFLHPKAAHGVVVQVAQASGDWTANPPPAEFPEPRPARPARLTRVVHCVASLPDAAGLFRDLLGGHEVDAGTNEDARWLDLAWPGPGRLRLTEPAAADRDELLAGAPGRIHALEFAVDDPEEVPDAHRIADDRWSVSPRDNGGVRLELTAR